jgi:hypothetical protein
LEDTQVLLEKSRNYYAKASADDKQTLRPEILDAEKKLERLIADTKSLEKRIRNAENSIINP